LVVAGDADIHRQSLLQTAVEVVEGAAVDVLGVHQDAGATPFQALPLRPLQIGVVSDDEHGRGGDRDGAEDRL
jgi:hypothetical protein